MEDSDVVLVVVDVVVAHCSSFQVIAASLAPVDKGILFHLRCLLVSLLVFC